VGRQSQSPRSLWVRITAPAAHPLFIVHCDGRFGWRLEAYRNAARQEVRDGLMLACHSPPIRVEHGESMSFTVSRVFQPLDDLSPGAIPHRSTCVAQSYRSWRYQERSAGAAMAADIDVFVLAE
jgi:hypothetical protein